MKWQWHEVNPDHPTTSGDIGKLFRNEDVESPGALAEGAPGIDAILLAREAIQNSWDAGRQFAGELKRQGIEPPSFRIRFRYRAVTGDDKADLIKALGLNDLAKRVNEVKDRRRLGLADSDCLAKLSDHAEPLRTLQIVEHGTTGMYGPWRGSESRLSLAMVSTGFTAKSEGSGGSYGYGKSGLIRGSKIRCVIAHTCFSERANDPGVTRRLLGMTYWGPHETYDGFARLGKRDGNRTIPYENDDADAFAKSVHLPLRDPEIHRDMGSTFLLVDPAVEPEPLREAIERYWWPAIEDAEVDFDVSVEDEQGRRLIPRPKRNEILRPFIRGFELALSPPDNSSDEEYRSDLLTYQPLGGSKRRLGVIGLVADRSSWSYATTVDDPDGGAEHASLVALVRSPRMVVQYHKAHGMTPHVRGTYLADDDIDNLLRQTEPKAHDRWLGKSEEEGIDPEAPKFAREVLKRVRAKVRDFRKQLKPPPPREQDIRLPLLDRLLRQLLHNQGSLNEPPPPGDPRIVAIGVDQQPEPAPHDLVRLRAKVTTRLTDNHPDPRTECRVVVRLALDEDGARGDDIGLEVTACPPGFEITPNVPGTGTEFVGMLDHEGVQFEVVSNPYDQDWTAQLIVTGDPVEPVVLTSTVTLEGGTDE